MYPAEERLSAEGARLLRIARDRILKDPDCFDMRTWLCRTTCCIGGHMARAMGIEPVVDEVGMLKFPDDWLKRLNVACGFKPIRLVPHPFYDLFIHWPPGQARNPETAATRINRVLFEQGYPPDEIVEPVPEEVACLVRR